MRPLVVLLMWWMAAVATPALAGSRVALVIGNGRYAAEPLDNPPADAALIAGSLEGVGFDVVRRTNLDQEAMKAAIQTFGQRLRSAGRGSVGIFYYAGHGVQSKGINYLIPVGASIEHEDDLETKAVPASWVTDQMASATEALNLVILDACRNNPYAAAFRADPVPGLAHMEGPRGTLIAYSAAPGQEAVDGEGKHSPYASALAQRLSEPGLEVGLLFREVRRDVQAQTEVKQTPWEEGALVRSFYFVPPAANLERCDDGELWQDGRCIGSTGALVVRGGPSDANVYIDGQPVGAPRLRGWNVLPGPHRIVVTKDARVLADANVTVRRGEGHVVSVSERVDTELRALDLRGGGRYALVIGNGAYGSGQLNNPPRDAALVGQTLRQVGFDVQVERDLDQREMETAIRRFSHRVRYAGPGAVALVYFAGHGAQYEGQNYLLPAGDSIGVRHDLPARAMKASSIARRLERAGTSLNLVILDACRNNPFRPGASDVRSGGTRGLRRMPTPRHTLIAYSAAPGQLAEDGQDGGHSPYAQALVEALRAPGLEVGMLFRSVRRKVLKATSLRQMPWEEGALAEPFYFLDLPQGGKVGCPEGLVWRDGTCVERKGWVVIDNAPPGHLLYLSVKTGEYSFEQVPWEMGKASTLVDAGPYKVSLWVPGHEVERGTRPIEVEVQRKTVVEPVTAPIPAERFRVERVDQARFMAALNGALETGQSGLSSLRKQGKFRSGPHKGSYRATKELCQALGLGRAGWANVLTRPRAPPGAPRTLPGTEWAIYQCEASKPHRYGFEVAATALAGALMEDGWDLSYAYVMNPMLFAERGAYLLEIRQQGYGELRVDLTFRSSR